MYISDKKKELEGRRENRIHAVHNVPLAAYQDTRMTLNGVKAEVCSSVEYPCQGD